MLTALGLRLAVILQQPEQLSVDRDAYLGIATSIVDGRGLSSPNSTTPTAFRPPLYPLLLAIGFQLLPQLPVVAEINVVAGLLTVWLTSRLGYHLQLGRLRFVAALIVAIDPLLLQYSARPMTESVCTLLASVWLWSMISGWPVRWNRAGENDAGRGPNRALSEPPKPRTPNGFVSGLAFGLLVLCRPTFWPIAGFFVAYWLIGQKSPSNALSKGSHRFFFRSGIRAAMGTMITVAPWLIRNWLVFGVPILTTTHGGYTLLLGNNPVFYEKVVRRPWGAVWPDISQRAWESERQSLVHRDLGPHPTEMEEDAWNSHQAKSYLVAHPGHAVEAAIHRIRSLWNTSPQGDAAEGVNKRLVEATRWFYIVILTSSFLGMLLVLRRADRKTWLPLYVLIISVQLVHLVYWTNTRMRAPLTPAIGLFAAAIVSRNRCIGEASSISES